MELPNIFIHGVDRNILYFLPVENVLNFCIINQQFSNICSDEIFWMFKFGYDYPGEVKPVELSYRDAYLHLARNTLKVFPVYFEDKFIFNVWIKHNNTNKEIYMIIDKMFSNLYPSIKNTIIALKLNNGLGFENSLMNGGSMYPYILWFKDDIFNWNNLEKFIIFEGNTVLVPSSIFVNVKGYPLKRFVY